MRVHEYRKRLLPRHREAWWVARHRSHDVEHVRLPDRDRCGWRCNTCVKAYLC